MLSGKDITLVGPVMAAVQLRSFEETLVLVGAIAAALIAYKLFKATTLASVITGLMAALAIGYVTFHEFTLRDGVITYRNRFIERSFPLEWVERASVETFWGGLPGRTYMFRMRRPPAPWNGYFRRTGLATWPSAKGWVETVNAAIEKEEAAGRR